MLGAEGETFTPVSYMGDTMDAAEKREIISEGMGRAMQIQTTTLLALAGAVVAGTVQMAAQRPLSSAWIGVVAVGLAMASILVGASLLWLNFKSLHLAWQFNDRLRQRVVGEVPPVLLRLNQWRFRLVPFQGLLWLLASAFYAAAVINHLLPSAPAAAP